MPICRVRGPQRGKRRCHLRHKTICLLDQRTVCPPTSPIRIMANAFIVFFLATSLILFCYFLIISLLFPTAPTGCVPSNGRFSRLDGFSLKFYSQLCVGTIRVLLLDHTIYLPTCTTSAMTQLSLIQATHKNLFFETLILYLLYLQYLTFHIFD